MADQATLQVRDPQGVPAMQLALTDTGELLLRGAEVLERQVELAEEAAEAAIDGNNIFSKLLRFLVTREMRETEQGIERLAAGVPLKDVEEIGLDSEGFKIQLNGHGDPVIYLDRNAVDWIEAVNFARIVDEARRQAVEQAKSE